MKRTVPRAFETVAAVLVAASAAAPLHSQTVEGTVQGPDGRVLVRLLGEEGTQRALQVTDPGGNFLMAAPEPGLYRVQVERMGFRPALGDTVRVAAGARVALRIPAPSEPLALQAAPPAPTVCTSDAAGTDRLSLAWGSVATAMEMALWNEERGELLLDAEVHRRRLEPDARTVVRAEVPEERTGISRLGPAVDAGDLLARGFIREDEEGSIVYFPPGPSVLVHPDFLATHCLRLQGPPGGALVGVAFEPREPGGADARPDVAGVVWIGAEDGKPVLLEFAYRNVDPGVVPASAGGRTTFAELPDGSWVTAETWLRMPLLRVLERDQEQQWQVTGLREERARLLRVRSRGESWAVTPATGALEGRVLDADAGLPLAGAVVRLVGTPREAETDELGRFSFTDLLDGVYRVSAAHPRFDQLPMGPLTPAVQVAPGETARVTLAPPAPREAALRLCSGTDASSGAVILTGQVVDSLSREPLVGLPLSIRFLDPRREGRPYHETRVASGAGGYYVYCDAPRGQTVRIRPALPGARAEDDMTFVALAPVEEQDITVALSTEQDESGVFGIIRDAATGDPIEAAEVTLGESGRRVLTNSNGFYAVAGVEPGLHVVTVSHLAYRTREVVVRVDGGQAYEVGVTLEVDAIPLEGITVTVVPTRLFGDMVDLQRRMELGFGEYVLRTELEERGGTLATILQGRAGVQVVSGPGRAGERFLVLRGARDLVQSLEMEGAALQFCFPAVWVDGHRWSQPRVGGVGHDPVDFTQFVTMDIEAVEIYRGAGSVPGEFGGGDAACGAVVIWSRRGGRTVRGDSGGSEAFSEER